jgi:hypothetical protein
MTEGQTVTVKDGLGKVIGTAPLGAGSTTDSPYGCTFPFTVMSLPQADIYSVEASHRGSLSYTRTQLEAAGWSVHLSLGK